MAGTEGEKSHLVYTGQYEAGDRIMLSVSKAGGYYVVQFEDTLEPALVYVERPEVAYEIPHGTDLVVFSPKSFSGNRHLIRARVATEAEIAARRNLAFNPYDRYGDTGIYPHAKANVETRSEAVFAAYNAIDGIFENSSHGEWPYQSWGINRDPSAEWTLTFGRPVCVDEIRITIRADFPHDSWWQQATVAFSDGSEEILELCKTPYPQSFSIAPRTVEWLTLKKLMKAQSPSLLFRRLRNLRPGDVRNRISNGCTVKMEIGGRGGKWPRFDIEGVMPYC